MASSYPDSYFVREPKSSLGVTQMFNAKKVATDEQNSGQQAGSPQPRCRMTKALDQCQPAPGKVWLGWQAQHRPIT